MSALDQPAHPLWVFIDESGNFDFSERGTRHFLMTAVATDDPGASATHLLRLKYEQMLRGSNQLDFHATHNSRGTRKRVLSLIGDMSHIRSMTVVFDKAQYRALPDSTTRFILAASTAIAEWACEFAGPTHDHVTLVFDTAYTTAQMSQVKHHLKIVIAARRMSYRIHFHRVANEPNGQIADYIAWSHFRMIERSDDEGRKHLRADHHEMAWI